MTKKTKHVRETVHISPIGASERVVRFEEDSKIRYIRFNGRIQDSNVSVCYDKTRKRPLSDHLAQCSITEGEGDRKAFVLGHAGIWEHTDSFAFEADVDKDTFIALWNLVTSENFVLSLTLSGFDSGKGVFAGFISHPSFNLKTALTIHGIEAKFGEINEEPSNDVPKIRRDHQIKERRILNLSRHSQYKSVGHGQ